MLKNIILGLAITGMLSGCNIKENERLKAKVDSLQSEVMAGQKAAAMLTEIGHMLDSINTKQSAIRQEVVSQTNYKDFSHLVSDLSSYIREAQNKLQALENSFKESQSSVNAYAIVISKLKKELEINSEQLALLKEEAAKYKVENQNLSKNMAHKDSVLSQNAGLIKVQEQNLAALEAKVTEVNKISVETQADLYFKQGQALELAAARTHFAHKKKKETMREALEFYKRSFALGKTDAKAKIEELEKVLS